MNRSWSRRSNYFKDAYRLAPKRPTPPPLIVERVA
jgi:pyrimidine-nucleoside phosphorylase